MKQFGILITILFVIVAFILIEFPPQKEITLKELSSKVAQHTSPKELAMREPAVIDSSEKDGKDKVQVDYYIIIGSYRNLKQAQQKAKKLINDFSTNIIILPSLKEGCYRISYGKYSTLEEAKTTIKNVRTKINSDAWIFSLKE
jgi:SPOR domain